MNFKLLILVLLLPVVQIIAPNIALRYKTRESSRRVALVSGPIETNLTGGNGPTIYLVGVPNLTWAVPAAPAWVTSDQDYAANLAGTEDYSVSLNLTGFNPNKATLDGFFAADDDLDDIHGSNISAGISAGNASRSAHGLTPSQGFVSDSHPSNPNFTNLTDDRGPLVNFTSATAAPEPGSCALAGLGLIGLSLLRKKINAY